MSVIFDVEPVPALDSQPHHATFDLYQFGQSVLADLNASSGRYARTGRKATQDGLDAILLQLFVEGEVQFGAGQRTTYASAGEIVVFDLAQPADNINTQFRHITCMWPRTVIEEVIPDIARWHGRTLPKKNPSVELLRQHMISCYQLAPRFSLNEGHQVELVTLTLAAAAMAKGNGLPDFAEAAPMAEMLLYQVKRHIRKHLGAADLSPAQIAHHFGISRTRLYKLFESVGGISRYQRHLRLQRCLTDLQDPSHSQKQISEIAYRWGFNHPATFNRNFRNAFDTTPGEARALALGGNRTITPCSLVSRKTQDSEKEHHQWFSNIGT